MSQSRRTIQESSAERRTGRRVPCELAIELRLGTATFPVELLNMSESGMFVRPSLASPRAPAVVAAVLKPGTRVFLRLHTAGVDAYEARCSVAWQSDYGVGVDFLELTAAFAALITRLVATDGDDFEPFAAVTLATLHVSR